MKRKPQVPMDAGKKGRTVLIMGLVAVSFIASLVWIIEH